mmetsp:Transcript_17790/g.36824  ORF Transcript_17790/g.36824 Transcript_17790/m.36824 type:complete len:86 (-) Transcript_17790:52-309(-)
MLLILGNLSPDDRHNDSKKHTAKTEELCCQQSNLKLQRRQQRSKKTCIFQSYASKLETGREEDQRWIRLGIKSTIQSYIEEYLLP